MTKHYYRYIGYADGSGIPDGIIIKCYTEKQADYMRLVGLVFEQIEEIQNES